MKKSRTIEVVFLSLALTVLTACDRSGARDMGKERESAAYREAMADYHAGRLESAIKGFVKVCRQDPSNASARFQLACLLQDAGKDYLGAMCAFREYMFQQPNSDKSETAKDRMAICEKEYSMTLAAKYGLDGGAALLKELEATRKRLETAEQRCAKVDQEVAQAMRRIGALQQENERLVKMIRNDSVESADTPAELTDAKALLDGGGAESDRIRNSADAAALRLEESEESLTDPRRLARDVAALRKEELSESESSSSIVPRQAPDAKARRDAARAHPKKEPLHESRPKTYVVQDGDTLYKIAMRFYGTSSAWKKIRDANKAVISTDGRVNTGLEIKLP